MTQLRFWIIRMQVSLSFLKLLFYAKFLICHVPCYRVILPVVCAGVSLIFLVCLDEISVFQVEEIYTSGGDLHLELPTGEREAPRDLWVRKTTVYWSKPNGVFPTD